MSVDLSRAKSFLLAVSAPAMAAARAAFLRDACGDDAVRRRRVEALLAADDGDRDREDDASVTSEADSAASPAATAANEEGTRADPGRQTTAAGAPGADRAAVDARGVILSPPPKPTPGPARSRDDLRRGRPEVKTVAVIDRRPTPKDHAWPSSDADERECRSNGDALRERTLPPKTSIAGSPSPHLADQGRIARDRRPIQ